MLLGSFLCCQLHAVAPAPPKNVLAMELAAGGSGTAYLKWDSSAGATSYKIYLKSSTTGSFVHHTNVTFPTGTTAEISGLDDYKSYMLAVVAVNASADESLPDDAAVPYACRRLDMTLPWNDETYSPATSFDDLNQPLSSVSSKNIPYASADAYRVEVGEAGHLVVNTTATAEPIRFTGMNLAWSSAFPESQEEAAQIAARMAQFGINLVRFHNQDAYFANESSKPERIGWFQADGVTLDSAQMAKLDRFIAELAKQGIYSDINLCVGRKFQDRNNPTGPYQRFKGLDQMDDDLIEAQENLAEQLLNHQNPYRGSTAYKNDPAIAILEINNENSLIDSWGKGAFDPGGSSELTGVYSTELIERWSDWLRTKAGPSGTGYGSASNSTLQSLWAAEAHAYTQAGLELLNDRDFAVLGGQTPANSPWKFQVYSPATAAAPVITTASVGGTTRDVLKLTVTTADAGAPQKAKLLYSPLLSYGSQKFDDQVPHALRFHARVGATDDERIIKVGFCEFNSPYDQLHAVNIKLTREWQQFDVLLPDILGSATSVSLTFTDLAAQAGEVWLSDVSLKEGNPFLPAGQEFAEQTTIIDSSNHLPDVFPTSGPVDGWYDSANGLSSDQEWSFVDKTEEASASFASGGTLAVSRTGNYVPELSDIILRRTGVELVAGRAYELSFEAKFTPNAGTTSVRISCAPGLEDDPFTTYQTGYSDVSSSTWMPQAVKFVAGGTGSRIQLNMGGLRGTVEFRNFELTETVITAAAPGDTLVGSGTVAWPTRSELRGRTRAFQRDWMNFLWDTETAYWKRMREYIQVTLGAKQLVIGTQGEYSPNYLQAQDMDIIDVHGYSYHPYPLAGQSYIKNLPMAGRSTGGALAPRQAKRILGKPFLCTEYNHPSPNSYGSEAFPLLAAFAGFHSWDGVVGFQYEDTDGNWDLGYESSFYQAGRSTGKMIQFPFLARSLRDGLFEPAASMALLVVDKATVIDVLLSKLKGGIGVDEFTNGDFKLDSVRSLEMDVATTMEDPLGGGTSTPIAYAAQPSSPLSSPVLISDSGDLAWDTTSGEEMAMITAPKAKALIGKLDPNLTYSLQDDVSITPGATMQTDDASSGFYWGGYALILKEDDRFGSGGSRWLLTTMGYSDNLFRQWEPGHGPYDTNNKIAHLQGGQAPNFVERIRGTVKFHVYAPNQLTAWDLDAEGNRVAPLDVTYTGSGSSRLAVVDLPASPISPWYEFSVQLPNTGFDMTVPSGTYTASATAIDKKDPSLAANAVDEVATSQVAPFRNTAWEPLADDDDADNLRASSSPLYASDGTYAFSIYDDDSAGIRGAKIGLRGQNLPLDKSWSFEVALRFESTTSLEGDEVRAAIGQSYDKPMIAVGLARDDTTSNYKVRLLTQNDVWVELPGTFSNATYVKVKIKVHPAQIESGNPDGTMEVFVNENEVLDESTLELPSKLRLPEELYLYTTEAATGIARVDVIKVTIP